MKLKKVLSICKTNGLYYLYDRIDRSGEITQWLGDGYALYPLDGLPILDEESFCAVFDITGKQREKILFRHERLPEHLNVEDVAACDKLVREYETTFINGGLRLKPLKTNNGVTFIRSLYLSPLEDVIDMVQFYERTTPDGGSYIVAKAGFLTAAVIMPGAHSPPRRRRTKKSRTKTRRPHLTRKRRRIRNESLYRVSALRTRNRRRGQAL